MKPVPLSTYVPRFTGFRVAVVGDMMLDRYIWGRASRISQEAPVPVVGVDRETETPGGAANVVRNVLALGGEALAFGVIGQDAYGDALLAGLEGHGADTRGLVRLARRPTTVKTRVIANNQQICRVDREDTSPVPPEALAALEKALLSAIRARTVHAVIFQDYAKGLLTREFMQRVVNAARRQRIITVLDPHPSHPYKVTGLHLMKPNRAEAFGLAGVYYRSGVMPLADDAALLEVCRKLHRAWRVENLLVTLGPGGMALFARGLAPLHIPTQAQEVFDVSGAGDTVTATYTLALLAGASPADAAHIANHAAGVVVGKIGTVPILAAELVAALRADDA